VECSPGFPGLSLGLATAASAPFLSLMFGIEMMNRALISLVLHDEPEVLADFPTFQVYRQVPLMVAALPPSLKASFLHSNGH
jgi:hypothetical protein